MPRPVAVAVVGATGAVGTELLRLIEERRFPVSGMRLLASPTSAGRELHCLGRAWKVQAPSEEVFRGCTLAFFDAGAGVSRQWVPVARAAGAVCVDISSAFRMDPAVPLVVPEVNGALLDARPGLVAGPNCTTAGLVVALAPLVREAGARALRIATYQAVSGAGMRAVEELTEQSKASASSSTAPGRVFPRPIAFNAIPHIDAFEPSGYTSEERKLETETRKILGLPSLVVSATAVRIPVVRGHSLAVWLETERALTVARAREILASAPGVRLEDDPAAGRYPTPLEAAGTDPVWVGRLRTDPTVPHGLAFWVVSDNLRKGAALNAMQIAERLLP